MKLFISTIVLITMLSFLGFSQSLPVSLIGTSGNHSEHLSFGSLDWSIGEPLVELFNPNTAQNPSLTQGFHQVFVNIVSSTEEDKLDETLILDVSLFPNPSNTWIKIKSNLPIRYRILNLHGQIIIPFDRPNDQYELDTGQIKSGMYLLEVFQDNHKIHKIYKLQIIH